MDRAIAAANQWRHELPGPDYQPMEVVGRLSEVALLLRRDWMEPLFAKHGVQLGEFDVLATLRRAGAPYALTPTQLFESAMISSGGMTNRLDRLEKNGWISRAPNPHDRRGTLVTLTGTGIALVEAIIPPHLANETRALSGLSASEQGTLNTLLGKLVLSLNRRETAR